MARPTLAYRWDALPLRMYDVGNRSGNGMWVAARDPQHAADIAHRLGHVTDPANARVRDRRRRWRRPPASAVGIATVGPTSMTAAAKP